jgi:short-subunit dehydrogenase
MAAERLVDLYPNAFVTGASAGLGRAFAEMLLSEGVRVWGTARDAGRLTETATRHPALFTPVVFDLADYDAGETAFKRASKSAGGAFDLVVNNAGYGVFGEFDASGFAVWQAQLETMLTATLRLSHAALREMRARGRGCLVNVSSLAVEFPLPFMSGYNVAKAGLAAFSESLIVETRNTGLTVIDFRPGDFRTDFNHAMQSVSPAASASHRAMARAWNALEANLRAAPPPDRAAASLRSALLRQRSGTVRAGSFFQARLAPFCNRLLPVSAQRWLAARYFGL